MHMNIKTFFGTKRRSGPEGVMLFMGFIIIATIGYKMYCQADNKKMNEYYKTHQEEISYKKVSEINLEALNQSKPNKLIALGNNEILYRDHSSHDMAIDKYGEGQIEIVKNNTDKNIIEIHHAYDKTGKELDEDICPYKYVLNVPDIALSTDYKILNTVQEHSGFRTHTVTYTPSGVDIYD